MRVACRRLTVTGLHAYGPRPAWLGKVAHVSRRMRGVFHIKDAPNVAPSTKASSQMNAAPAAASLGDRGGGRVPVHRHVARLRGHALEPGADGRKAGEVEVDLVRD